MFVVVTEIKQNVQTNLSRHVPVPRDYKIVINYKTIHTFKENTHSKFGRHVSETQYPSAVF